nr:hypothetical protein [Acrocarpospora macrocephala]
MQDDGSWLDLLNPAREPAECGRLGYSSEEGNKMPVQAECPVRLFGEFERRGSTAGLDVADERFMAAYARRQRGLRHPSGFAVLGKVGREAGPR